MENGDQVTDVCVPKILGGGGVSNPNNPLIYATDNLWRMVLHQFVTGFSNIQCLALNADS